jgi:hypothetical protein
VNYPTGNSPANSSASSGCRSISHASRTTGGQQGSGPSSGGWMIYRWLWREAFMANRPLDRFFARLLLIVIHSGAAIVAGAVYSIIHQSKP